MTTFCKRCGVDVNVCQCASMTDAEVGAMKREAKEDLREAARQLCKAMQAPECDDDEALHALFVATPRAVVGSALEWRGEDDDHFTDEGAWDHLCDLLDVR